MTDEVCLRSGLWMYHYVTVSGPPEGRPETTHVFFHLRGDSSSLMRVRVSGVPDKCTDFGELARRPDSREASLEGERWTFYPAISRDDLHTVVFMSTTGGLGVGALPAGVTLAEAMNHELHGAVKNGRMR